jgi:methylmalonyl-CoA/ethylmalonyl-CoA epimerase
MPKITGLHHIALVVPEVETALAFWRDRIGLPLGGVEDVPEQGSRVAFLPVGGSEVELVQPTSEDSSAAKFLQKRGPGLHHICFEVDDLDGMVTDLRATGIKMVGGEPTLGAGGRRMMFIHPGSTGGVLVELYESEQSRGKPRDIEDRNNL